MKSFKAVVGIAWALGCVISASAHAAWDGPADFALTGDAAGEAALTAGAPLPSDLGPVSIEASRRELRADMQDWSDDLASNKGRRILSCTMASMESGFFLGPVSSLATLGLLTDLQKYLGKNGPAAPLFTPLSELAKTVPFTAAEQKQLGRLMNREAPDLTDRIRLAIDTQGFLMKVAQRLYDEQIAYHFKRTEGFWGFFRADPEFCSAYSLLAERDANLVAAGNRVLALYDFLEQQLKD